jgi:cytochrome c oxidase subunit 4
MAHGSKARPHIVPLQVYLGVALGLLLMTVVTVAVSYVPLGGLNVVVALSIAAFKAALVALFFMHLKYDRKIYAIIFLGAVLFLALFIIFTMFDTMYRDPVPEVPALTSEPTAASPGVSPVDSTASRLDSAAVPSQSPEGQ